MDFLKAGPIQLEKSGSSLEGPERAPMNSRNLMMQRIQSASADIRKAVRNKPGLSSRRCAGCVSVTGVPSRSCAFYGSIGQVLYCPLRLEDLVVVTSENELTIGP